jgi:hypothetical protein
VFGAFSYNNNVLCTLSSAITSKEEKVIDIEVVSGGGFNGPPEVDIGDAHAIFTLVDDVTFPTKVEIIEAEKVTDLGSGAFKLEYITRGMEGTAAEDWDGGATVFQSMTKSMFNPPWMAYSADPGEDDGVARSGFTWSKSIQLGDAGDSFAITRHESAILTVVADNVAAANMWISAELNVDGFAEFRKTTTFLSTVTFTGNTTINNLKVNIASGGLPSSSSATGIPGTIKFGSDYIYVCVGANNWKRVALSTF